MQDYNVFVLRVSEANNIIQQTTVIALQLFTLNAGFLRQVEAV
jgi:hypothetical protein